jgi:hypothetical protein
MGNLALLDSMQLEISPAAGTTGALVGGTLALVGQFTVPVGLATGIFGAISEDTKLRNRGFAAAGIGLVAFIAGITIAAGSVAAVEV